MDNNSNKNLLLLVGQIAHEASLCKLDFSKFGRIKDEVSTVGNFLDISFRQAVLFSCIVELSLYRLVTLESLSRHIKCSSILKVIAFLDEIEELEKKSLVTRRIRCRNQKPSYNDIGFQVPNQVVEALRTSDKSHLHRNHKMDFPNLLKQISIAVSERQEEIISTQELTQEVETLIQNNREYSFIQYLNKNLVNTINKCVALVLAYNHFTGIVLMDKDSLPEAIFDDFNDQIQFKRSIFSGHNELIGADIITLQHFEFANERVLSLSPRSTNILYQEYPELKIQESEDFVRLKSDNITEKPLFFEMDLNNEIKNIEDVLKNRKFKSFQKEAEKSKLNRGITSIFYGHSGTGKTEAVYQIAKKTGRDIMLVDLSQTKSMWFGESEKQVKKIFDDYKQLLQTMSVEPVLFINEVDGLFSKRLNLGNNATSSSQTLNTIQNIILQELENFNGILFATTNRTENLDTAFERRFLFKVKFTKPDKITRKRIWKSKLPELTEKMANVLGERFEFTGGQIDNQVRQLILKKVQQKKLNIFEALMESCAKEKKFTDRIPVGF